MPSLIFVRPIMLEELKDTTFVQNSALYIRLAGVARQVLPSVMSKLTISVQRAAPVHALSTCVSNNKNFCTRDGDNLYFLNQDW